MKSLLYYIILNPLSKPAGDKNNDGKTRPLSDAYLVRTIHFCNYFDVKVEKCSVKFGFVKFGLQSRRSECPFPFMLRNIKSYQEFYIIYLSLYSALRITKAIYLYIYILLRICFLGKAL